MEATIRSACTIDSSKSTTISYCDSNRNIPVTLVGIAPKDFTEDKNLLTHIHSRISSIVTAFEGNSIEKLTGLTLEMSN